MKTEETLEIWRVYVKGEEYGGCICSTYDEAAEFIKDDPDLLISKERMEKSRYENLKEFTGF